MTELQLPTYVLKGWKSFKIVLGVGAVVVCTFFYKRRRRADEALTPAEAALRQDIVALFSKGPIKALPLSSRSQSQVPSCLFSVEFDLASSLLSLDLSRNKIRELPSAIGGLASLKELNVSRNWLRALPSELGKLKYLVKLDALSNELRPSALPLDAMASLPRLQVLDLRYNDKLGQPIATLLTARLPATECRITIKVPQNQKLHAADRDATLLRSVLEPHCTPTLRRRLALVFGDVTNPEEVTREVVMERLLAHYKQMAPRAIRHVQGVPVSPALCEDLLKELKAWVAVDDLKGRSNDRPTIRAQHYMILRSPDDFGVSDSSKAGRAAYKLAQFSNLWLLARRVVEEWDADYAKKYTAVAFTKNFEGSPHIDTQNIGPFCGLALGDFSDGGGALCVECSAREVAHVDTRNRLGKVDGRFPHWVAPYTGDRYSVIYYQTLGEAVAQTTAVFSGEPLVEDPPTFNPCGYQYRYCAETNTFNP